MLRLVFLERGIDTRLFLHIYIHIYIQTQKKLLRVVDSRKRGMKGVRGQGDQMEWSNDQTKLQQNCAMLTLGTLDGTHWQGHNFTYDVSLTKIFKLKLLMRKQTKHVACVLKKCHHQRHERQDTVRLKETKEILQQNAVCEPNSGRADSLGFRTWISCYLATDRLILASIFCHFLTAKHLSIPSKTIRYVKIMMCSKISFKEQNLYGIFSPKPPSHK